MAKKIALIVLFVCMSFITYAHSDVEPYAELWFTAGDSFDLDGVSHTIHLSSRSNTVLIRTEESSQIISLGTCIETTFRRVCFTSYEMYLGSPRVKFSFYEKNIDLIYDVNVSKNFVHEVITLDISWESVSYTLHDVTFSGILPSYMRVIQSAGCTVSVQGDSIHIYSHESRLQAGRKRSCTLRLESTQARLYTFVGEISYRYDDEQFTVYTSPTDIFFLPPYGVAPIYSESYYDGEPFLLTLRFENHISQGIFFEPVKFLIPLELSLQPTSLFAECNYVGRFLECYTTADLFSEVNFDLEFKPSRPGDHVIFFHPKYRIGRTVFEDPVYSIPIFVGDTPEDDTPLCVDQDTNFNITAIVDNSSELYLGGSTSIRFFVNNEGPQRVENVTARVILENIIAENTFSGIPSESSFFVSDVFIKPKQEITEFRVYVRYSCPDGSLREEFMPFNLLARSFEDFILHRDFFPREPRPGEVVTVSLSVETRNNIRIPSVTIREIFPESLDFWGTTRASLTLSENTRKDVYRYSFRAPFESFSLQSIAEFMWDGNSYTYVHDDTIEVFPKDGINITARFAFPYQTFQNEPVKTTVYIDNNDVEPIYNLSVFSFPGQNFDLVKFNETFPVLYPGQSVSFDFTFLPKLRSSGVYFTLDFFDQYGIFDDIIFFPIENHSDPRYQFYFPRYTMAVLYNDTFARITYSIFNDFKTEFSLQILNTSHRIQTQEHKTIEKVVLMSDIPKRLDMTLAHNVLGNYFFIVPDEIIEMAYVPPEELVQEEIIPEKEITGLDTTSSSDTFESDVSHKSYLLFLVFLFVFLFFFGILLFFVLRNKKPIVHAPKIKPSTKETVSSNSKNILHEDEFEELRKKKS